VLTTVPIFASILRVPFAAVAPMIVVSCAIGAYAIQNAMFDIWLMLGFGVVGYVFKKIGIPLAPFTLVLGNRAEDAFRLSMIGSGGDMKVFWSNGLITTDRSPVLACYRQSVWQRHAADADGEKTCLAKYLGRIQCFLTSLPPIA
jgi:TctA family transporter